MKLSEQQLSMSLSQLSVKDFLSLMQMVKYGDNEEKEFFYPEEWIKGTAGLAKFAHTSRQTISHKLRDGLLDGMYIKTGNTYMFNTKKIRRLLESNTFFT